MLTINIPDRTPSSVMAVKLPKAPLPFNLLHSLSLKRGPVGGGEFCLMNRARGNSHVLVCRFILFYFMNGCVSFVNLSAVFELR